MAQLPDDEDIRVTYLGGAAVRVTHVPTGESKESHRHVVLSMNLDAALEELRLELMTRPD